MGSQRSEVPDLNVGTAKEDVQPGFECGSFFIGRLPCAPSPLQGSEKDRAELTVEAIISAWASGGQAVELSGQQSQAQAAQKPPVK